MSQEPNKFIIQTKKNELQSPINDEKVLILDLDNTIYHYTKELCDSHNYHSAKLAIKHGMSPENAEQKCFDFYKKYGFTALGLKNEYNIEFKESFEEVDIKILENFKFVFDKNLLKILVNIKIRKFIYTNSYFSVAEHILKKLGMLELFDGVFCTSLEEGGDERGFYYKRYEKSYEFVENYLGARPENIYFFDDSQGNLDLAKSRGWQAFMATHDSLCKNLLNVLDIHFGVNLDEIFLIEKEVASNI